LCEGCESKNIEIPVTRARGILVENLCTKFWGKGLENKKEATEYSVASW